MKMSICVLGFDSTQDDKGKPLTFPDAWSYSRLSDYETCPAMFAYKHVIKIPTEDNEVFKYGRRIHKLAEDYVNGVGSEEVPPELQKFATLFRELRGAKGVFTEEQWAFAQDWSVTGWFAKPPKKAPWVRNVIDLGVLYADEGHVLLIDHKTGKMRDTNEDQIEQFAMSAFLRYPTVNTVEARLWYIDSGDEVIRNYSREALGDLKAKWKRRTEPMFNDKVFAPRKNPKCAYCDFSKKQGGPCRIA
jgi:CRISPR/Cas system-associated exonuclease Cas4 (RecB family)